MKIKSETKHLFIHTSIYGIGNILIKSVAFLLIPLYAHKLIPQEYGIVALLEFIEQLGKAILPFGLANAVIRFLPFYQKEDKEDIYVVTLFFFLFLINSIVLIFLFIFASKFSSVLLGNEADYLKYFRAILLVIYSGVFQSFFMNVLRAKEKSFLYVIFTLINFLILLGLNIYFVGFKDQGIWGIVSSKLIVAALNFIFIIFYFLGKYKKKTDFALIKENISYGIPLVFVGLAVTLLTLSDRYLLKILSDLSNVGIYSMAYKFGMIINIVLITPFSLAFTPMIFRIAENRKVEDLYSNYFFYFSVICFSFFLFIAFFAKELMQVFTSPQYVIGYKIVPIITFSYILYGLRQFFVSTIALSKKTFIIAIITVMAALVNIIFNLILIPFWGFMGAAIATMVAYLFLFYFTYIPQQKYYPIKWDWSRFYYLVFLTSGLYGLSFLINIINISFIIIISKILLLISFPILLIKLNFFKSSEKLIIHNFINIFMKINFFR